MPAKVGYLDGALGATLGRGDPARGGRRTSARRRAIRTVRALVTKVVAMIRTTIRMLALVAGTAIALAAMSPTLVSAAERRASPTVVKGFDTTPLSLAPGDSWLAVVVIPGAGPRRVQVQIGTTTAGWSVASTVRTRKGRASVGYQFTDAGQYQVRLRVLATRSSRAVTTRAKPVTVAMSYPASVQGTLSGHVGYLSWSGSVGFTYAADDPTMGTPWDDGFIHYPATAVGIDWVYDDSAAGGPCVTTGRGSLGPDQARGELLVADTSEPDLPDWGYQLNVSALPQTMPATVSCPEQEPAIRDVAGLVGAGGGALLYNTYTGSNPQTNWFTAALNTYAGTSVNPAGQDWTWSLTGSGDVTPMPPG
jgi:hypothetical protein